MYSVSPSKLALFVGLVSVAKEVQAVTVNRGVAWATNNAWAPAFANSSVNWYHHWQMGPISQMPSNMEYVPMDWGPQYASLWQTRQAQMNVSQPKYLLAYNEPDVPSQANMTPSAAVTDFMSELQPWREKGVLVSSPQIVWNLTWMADFMSGIQAQGADVDFMAIHYYGSWNDTKTPQTYIKKIYSTYGKKIWITELGTTQASNGTQEQQMQFMNTMLTWMAAQTYIDRVVWSGAWSINSPPDNYIAVQDGMFYSNATLRPIGTEYAAASNLATSSTTLSSSSSSSSSSTKTSSSTSSTSTKTSSSASTKMTSSSSSNGSSSSTVSSAPKATITTQSVAKTSATSHSTSSSKATSTAKTSSSTKKATTTAKPTSSTKKTTSTAKKTSTSTKHHKHHSTTSTKHHSTTSTKPASKATVSSQCRVLVGINKGNVVSAAKRKELEEEE